MRISDWSSDVCSSDLDAAVRQAQRQTGIAPLLADLERWLRDERDGLARQNPVARAIDYMLKDWSAFTRFLDDGRICLTNNAAERALRGLAQIGRAAGRASVWQYG